MAPMAVQEPGSDGEAVVIASRQAEASQRLDVLSCGSTSGSVQYEYPVVTAPD